MDSRRLMVLVLATLFVVGLALSSVAAWHSGDWWGFALNLGTELVGAVVTYTLFDQFIERTRESEKERAAEQTRLEAEKETLIAEMGSSVQAVAVAAAEKLGQQGWLEDGSLQWAHLENANLQGAILEFANLRGAVLGDANLREASLVGADLRRASLVGTGLRKATLVGSDLQGASLVGADLQEANLVHARLDGNTTLPDDTHWTPDTDMARFTDPDHPEFWRSDDPGSPAHRGKDNPGERPRGA